jgi:glucuronate isomerase
MKMKEFTYQIIYQLLIFTGHYKTRIMRWTGTVACIGKMRIAYNILPTTTER